MHFVFDSEVCGWFLLLILFVWPWFNPIPFSRSHFVKRFAKSSSLRELSGQQSIFLRFHFANQKTDTGNSKTYWDKYWNQSVLFSSGCLIFNNVQIWSFVTRGQRHLWEYYHENGGTQIAHLISSSFPSFVQIDIIILVNIFLLFLLTTWNHVWVLYICI